MKITRIGRQKRKKDLYSVYIDGDYAFSVTDENRVRYGLTEGREVTADEVSGILSEDEKRRAMDYAFTFIEARARSAREIEEQLRHKEFSPSATSNALRRLGELGYINDERYARDRLQYLMEKGIGPNRIRMELRQKGVSPALIDGLLREQREDPEDESRRLGEIARRKLNSLKNVESRVAAQRLTGFLARRGFSIDSIRRVLRELRQEIDDEA